LGEGRKDDTGKERFDLLPVDPLFKVVQVYTMGAQKYADRNWEKGIKYGRVFAALMRHAWKWWRGETYDQVDGQHHLSSVVWCAMALMEYEETHPELDDRPNTKYNVLQSTGNDGSKEFYGSSEISKRASVSQREKVEPEVGGTLQGGYEPEAYGNLHICPWCHGYHAGGCHKSPQISSLGDATGDSHPEASSEGTGPHSDLYKRLRLPANKRNCF